MLNRIFGGRARFIMITGLFAIPALIVTFFAGSFAQKHCYFPFCQGYLGATTSLIESGQGVFGDGLMQVSIDTLDTTLYEVQAQVISLTGSQVNRRHMSAEDIKDGRDGGIITFDNHLIVASRTGELLHIDKAYHETMLSNRIPVPYEAFEASIEGTEYDTGTEERAAVERSYFGVKDIYLKADTPDDLWLFASYNNWDTDEECFTLKVDRTSIAFSDSSVQIEDDWDTVYETSPCLELTDEWVPFPGHMSGGRVSSLDNTLLVGVGGMALPEDDSSPFTTIVAIDLDNLESRIFSRGHRNTQGLFVDENNQIWSTEHGPRGGDELNLIEEGQHYGWPYVSYGVRYGQFADPPRWDGSHSDYTRPIFSWSSAIAPAQVISLKGNEFDLWRGDLLVGSMQTRNLYRVRIREGRTVLAEPINIGWRIRDLVEKDDGSIVLKTDHNALVVLQPTGSTGTIANFQP